MSFSEWGGGGSRNIQFNPTWIRTSAIKVVNWSMAATSSQSRCVCCLIFIDIFGYIIILGLQAA